MEKETITKKNKLNYIPFEPLMKYRFNIVFLNFKGDEIKFHDQSIRNFNLSSVNFDNKRIKRVFKDKKFLNLKIELLNIVGNLIRPEQIFDINKIIINFLDPIGSIIDYYSMKVELDNFELMGDYGNNELSTYKLSFFISYLETREDELVKNN